MFDPIISVITLPATLFLNHTWPTVFFGLISFYAYKWIKKRKKDHSFFKKLDIPYVKPGLFDGSLLKLRANGGSDGMHLIGKWLKQHGNVFGYFIGWRPYLLIADLDIVKRILIKDFSNFANRPSLPIKAEPVINTLVGLRDHRWKEVRSILSPTFSMVKMKMMTEIMNNKIDKLLSLVAEKVDKNEPVPWYTVYDGLTLDTISECALAMKSKSIGKEDDPLMQAVRQFLKHAVNPAIMLAICFPTFSKFLTFVSNKLALSGRATELIVSNLKMVIKERRKNLNTKNIDILQLMLDVSEMSKKSEVKNSPEINGNTKNGELSSKQNETLNHLYQIPEMNEIESDTNTDIKQIRPKKVLLTDEEIIANAWVFLLGGFETTSSALTCVTYLLAKHPEIQERLYQEIASSIEHNIDHISYDDVTHLTYLDQIFNETLRLYPPVVSFISREAKEDILLGDIFIPRMTCIQIPVWNIHRDPSLWPDPEKFDPERFSQNSKLESDRHPMAFIPFGAGPRNCIGMRFATLESKLAIARIVRKFRLEPCDETPDPIQFRVPTVTMNPEGKVLLRAVRRS